MTAHAAAGESIEALLGYLSPQSRVNRFFWAPEGRLSTGIIAPERVTIRNARTAGQPFTLDRNGFTLARYPTALSNIRDQAGIRAFYGREVDAIVKDLTGADLVVSMGAEVRSSLPDGGAIHPPAARVHIDYDAKTARRVAERRYRRVRPEGPPPARFILLSIWRCFSPPPQDWPLALCDYQSCKGDRAVRVAKIDVERLPEGDARFAPIDGEEDMGASGLFTFNPAHRWSYYPDMTRDEIIAIKFHDSDDGRARRAPHSAFHDESRAGAVPRESIEFRVAAFFTEK
ncbi:MAG: hypothetical protein BGP16_01195 [Sphingobium sp. 66-54]|nr:MAG: hypothetical protein BGP16_01195 [Sphingobium sp. 66-54]